MKRFKRSIPIFLVLALTFSLVGNVLAAPPAPESAIPPPPSMPNIAQEFREVLRDANCGAPGIVHNRTSYHMYVIGDVDGEHRRAHLPPGRSSNHRSIGICDVDLFTVMGTHWIYEDAWPPTWPFKRPGQWARIAGGSRGFTVTCGNIWSWPYMVRCDGSR